MVRSGGQQRRHVAVRYRVLTGRARPGMVFRGKVPNTQISVSKIAQRARAPQSFQEADAKGIVIERTREPWILLPQAPQGHLRYRGILHNHAAQSRPTSMSRMLTCLGTLRSACADKCVLFVDRVALYELTPCVYRILGHRECCLLLPQAFII